MTDTPTQIAARLEACFVENGFQEPGVDALRDAAGVSLRTLYKYYPSREAMIIGALEHRHERYLSFLQDGVPSPGKDAVDHLFSRIEDWMQRECGTCCLFLNALAAHPSNDEIRKTVTRHKDETRNLIAQLSGRPDLADQLFLLHEGATAAWALMKGDAVRSARASALGLLGEFESAA